MRNIGNQAGSAPARSATRKLRHAACAAGVISLFGLAPLAHAQSLGDALRQTTFQGMVGAIHFDYGNNGHSTKSTHSFAIGGHLIAHTGSFDGFSVGLGGYTAQSLGLYSKNNAGDKVHYDGELTGSHYGIQSFRQAYLQYQTPKVEIRFGRQLIQTPYANQDYYTFNPRAFMGVAGVVNVLGDGSNKVDAGALSLDGNPAAFSVFMTRMFTYESRYASSFVANNRYSGTKPTNGFIAIGARYHGNVGSTQLTAQAWYYDFYQYAQLLYGQVDLVQPLANGQAIFGSVQGLTEGNSAGNASRIEAFTSNSSNSINAHLYGAKLGYSFGDGSIALIGNYAPTEYNSFHHGGVLHPYNDNTGTSFTDTMQNGVPNLGPGYAYGITSNYDFLNKKLKVGVTYVRYLVRYGYGGDAQNYTSYAGPYSFPNANYIPNQQLWALDANASYDLSSILKGLSVAEDTDVTVAENRAGYTGTAHYNNPYFSSRFYLEYNF
ncbi:unnamed protein product [Acidocella sp. C78]|uniref:hypothetical protein n=1 Tax=Acidocella sp. C78 TaxID=1671486 RepID=UPI00191BAB55|nr:hypothetical protein [Acidocella sp. C78]CAG4928961.1 unnamed protein product [Acidocella sp. C78]